MAYPKPFSPKAVDLLSYAQEKVLSEEKELLNYLGNLRVNMRESVTPWGKKQNVNNRGQRLRDFSFYNCSEKFKLKWMRGDKPVLTSRKQRQLAEYLNAIRGNEAEKIVRTFKYDVDISYNSILPAIKNVFEELYSARHHSVSMQIT